MWKQKEQRSGRAERRELDPRWKNLGTDSESRAIAEAMSADMRSVFVR